MKAELYFDSHCRLCNKEIALLKRLANNEIRFVDAHAATEGFNAVSLPDKSTLLKRLYCRKPIRQWLTGLDANVYTWSKTPFSFLFAILRFWPIRPIANALYSHWADRRFEKRYCCETCPH
jgi:predicted DCC family thiol-disulfide oxidoreductase YuxK